MSFPTEPAAAAAAEQKDSKNIESPYEMKAQDKEKTALIPTTLAFENSSFLRGNAGRLVRIICEFQEPAERLRQHNIKGTILFFGSARSMSQKHYDETIEALRVEAAKAQDDAKKAELAAKVARFEKVQWMCPIVEKIEELSRRLTQWSMARPKLNDYFSKQPDYMTGHTQHGVPPKQPLVVCTGGGPGIMEAANRGASSVEGAMSMGFGITLPFEKGLNPYCTPSLAFESSYFFTRKYSMTMACKALIVGPGGMGTCDEVFELLTLRQTGKLMVTDLPIVFFGKTFWKTIVNWQAMADYGVVSQAEIDKLFFTDDVGEAYDYITKAVEADADALRQVTISPGRPANAPGQGAAAPPPMDVDMGEPCVSSPAMAAVQQQNPVGYPVSPGSPPNLARQNTRSAM